MSLEHIRAVTKDFISDTNSHLLVIKGKWGAGKTFFWQDVINECQSETCVGRDFYSYVSLFGVNSLEELNNSILTSRVDSNPNKAQKRLDTLTANLKNLARVVENIPALREYTGGMISALLHLLLENTLVCFDDIERRGDGLTIRDIFGLASVLKEQRGCKVVLIMNEEGLDEDAQKQFKLHGEKVIDRHLSFSIPAEESFDYIFQPSFPNRDLIKSRCLSLHIENIRTLQRIKRSIGDMTPHLNGLEEQVTEGVLRSLILFVWSHYEQASGAPPLKFVLDYSPVNLYLAKQNKKELSPEDKKWNEILGAYNYFRNGKVDECLADYVQTGYVDKPKLSHELEKENEQARVQKGQHSYSEVWGIYRNSFDDNEQAFVEALVSNFRSNIRIMSLENLQSVVSALRDFERGTVADGLVDEYFGSRNSEEDIKGIMLLQGTIFISDVKDEYILSRLHSVWESTDSDRRSLAEVVNELSEKSWWSREDIRRLDSFATDDYYNFFKSEKSPNLYFYVRKCLDFGKADDGSGIYKSVGEKAKEALLKIASESRINRMRVSTLYKLPPQAPQETLHE